MATKMHNWDTATDGPIPVTSWRYRNMQPVRISDDDGEHFGWESPSGRLYCGTLVAPSAAKQAQLDAAEAAMLAQKAIMDARTTKLDAIRAKREAGTPLTDADVETLADVVLGRPVS